MSEDIIDLISKLEIKDNYKKLVQTWLKETEGKLDVELCKQLGIKNFTNYKYEGKLSLEQRIFCYNTMDF